MTNKDFCIKILEIANELNSMAKTALDDLNEDQYDVCKYLRNKTLDKYKVYKKTHKLKRRLNMIKNIYNKKYGSGEQYITYSLWVEGHIASPRFDTKKELNKWIKENKAWINHEMNESNKVEILQTTEIYANKVIDTLNKEED